MRAGAALLNGGERATTANDRKSLGVVDEGIPNVLMGAVTSRTR